MYKKEEHTVNDEHILDLFKTDPKYAFHLMFDAYYIPLCLYTVQITDSFCLSEDIVQDFFVTFWEKKIYQGIAVNLKSYLFYSVRNNAYLVLKKNKLISLEELSDIEVTEMDVLADEQELKEAESKILEELEKLPKQERIVVEAIILENRRYKEVALELDISVNTVKTHLARALKRLRKTKCSLLFFYI